MRRVLAVGLIVLAALAQATWAPRLEIAGAFPNLVLIAVVTLTGVLGARSGLIAAGAGGLLLDLTASGPIGPHVLALLLGVYVVGWWMRDLEQMTVAIAVFSVVVVTLLYSGALVMTDVAMRLTVPSPLLTVELALAAAAYNALLAPFALALVGKLQLGRSAPNLP